MCLILRESLTVGKIAFHAQFLSTELNAPEAKKALTDEMLNVCNITRTHKRSTPRLFAFAQYCVVTEAAKTTFGKVHS